MERAGRDHLAEQLAWTEQMFLADDFVERARTHPIGQRLRHRMPRPEESIIVVGLAPCHCEDVITIAISVERHAIERAVGRWR